MDLFAPFLHALPHVLHWESMLAMVVGMIGGVIVGALPGLSAPMGISLLIPLTFGMEPLVALGLLAGMHNGASYGGAIPAVLLRIPGTPSALVTCFDGYPMAQKGMAGTALRISVVSSTVGGVISALSLMLLAPPLMLVTLAFGPPEIFWVTVFGLAAISVLLGDRPAKGMISACIGLLIGLVGMDTMNSQERFTFGILELIDGPMLLVVLTGIYALPPAWQMAERALGSQLSKEDLRFKDTPGIWSVRSLWRIWMQSSIIGIIIGILPGSGGGMTSFIAYNEAKRISKRPQDFGRGSPEGLAAAEASNNADNAAAMIPTLTLGVPGSGVAALMLGALLVHGLHPGPDLFRATPDIAYGYMLQMLITAALTLPIGGFFATRIFAQVLRLPQIMLAVLIVALTIVGVYTVNNSMFDVYLLLGFGLLGYFMNRLKYPEAPLVLGLVLGPAAEYNLRLSLTIGRGDWTILFTRPISLAVLGLTVLVLVYPVIRHVQSRRRGALGAGHSV